MVRGISDVFGEVVLIWGSCYDWRGRSWCSRVRSLGRACDSSAPGGSRSAARFRRSSARVFSPYVVQAGSARPRGAGGPAPTAFNRAGEKVRATRGRLPRVSCEVGPRRVCGLAVPSSGRRSECRRGVQAVKRSSGGLRWAAGGAGGDGGVPAGAVDDHGVDPAQQRGGAGDPGLSALRAAGRGAGLP